MDLAQLASHLFLKNKSLSYRIYLSLSTNPWFNLATEDWIFRQLKENEHALLLWRNEPCVVIGRAQNPWIECNLENMKKHGVKLARRQSGGGTVFHDLGNLNFSFLSPKQDYDKKRNLGIIAKAMQNFGLNPIISERHDILISHQNESYKISGSAFRETKDFAFHHGTLLLNADIPVLRDCLRPRAINIEATGVKSVRSKVINLCELNPALNYEDMLKAISEAYSDTEIEVLDEKSLRSIPNLMQTFEEYQSWEWQFGKTLPFVHKIQEISLHIKKGLIEQVVGPESLKELEGLPYQANSIESISNLNLKKMLLDEIP
ncbi:MAG: lplA [Gammaproteobacteria bacterium]|nr:lplA [Gammaproteobacteria bacterium]